MRRWILCSKKITRRLVLLRLFEILLHLWNWWMYMIICSSSDLIWQSSRFEGVCQIKPELNFFQPRLISHQLMYPWVFFHNTFFPDGYVHYYNIWSIRPVLQWQASPDQKFLLYCRFFVLHPGLISGWFWSVSGWVWLAVWALILFVIVALIVSLLA